MTNNDLTQLLECAGKGYAHAYAPYSNFKVGAAILAEDGGIYQGSNVENAAYPQGQCAEATAIGAMITAGARHIEKILIMGASITPLTPCGGCRQRILEFSTDKTEILTADPNGEITGRYNALALIPHHFGAETLES